jgi:hypothetical protein
MIFTPILGHKGIHALPATGQNPHLIVHFTPQIGTTQAPVETFWAD